jgi:hypothetical protein
MLSPALLEEKGVEQESCDLKVVKQTQGLDGGADWMWYRLGEND